MPGFTKVPSLKSKLEKQIGGLKKSLKIWLQSSSDFESAYLIGSCSEGQATYRSDIDVLVVTRNPQLRYDQVVRWRNDFEGQLKRMSCEKYLSTPLPLQMNFVKTSVYDTREPAMRAAMKKAKTLVKPKAKGILK